MTTSREGRPAATAAIPFPERADVVRAFRRWGVNDDTQVVAYDANGGNFAVRLWWLARWLGHTRVAVLDGGWPRWLAETGLSSTEAPARAPGKFTDRSSSMPLVRADDVVRNLGTHERLVLDARTPERYRGEQEPIDPVAGHIPGARNRPWQRNLEADQTFKSPQALRQEFEAALGSTRAGPRGPPVRIRRDGVPQPPGHGDRRPGRLGALCRFVERVDRGPGPARRDRRRSGRLAASARARCRWRPRRSPRRAARVPPAAATWRATSDASFPAAGPTARCR